MSDVIILSYCPSLCSAASSLPQLGSSLVNIVAESSGSGALTRLHRITMPISEKSSEAYSTTHCTSLYHPESGPASGTSPSPNRSTDARATGTRSPHPSGSPSHRQTRPACSSSPSGSPQRRKRRTPSSRSPYPPKSASSPNPSNPQADAESSHHSAPKSPEPSCSRCPKAHSPSHEHRRAYTLGSRLSSPSKPASLSRCKHKRS